ncbi:hypothetical protein FQZ97_828140 [compost metagenome]
MRQSFGDHHAIAFVQRGQHKHVGRRVVRVQRLSVDIAVPEHAISHGRCLGLQASGGAGVARGAAHVVQFPVQRHQARQRLQQQAVALARRERGHAEQAQRALARWLDRPRQRVGARLHHGGVHQRHAHRRNIDRRVRAGHHHPARMPQRARLTHQQVLARGIGQAGFQMQRVVHEGHPAQAHGVPRHRIVQCAEGQAVGHHQGAIGQRSDDLFGGGELRGAGVWPGALHRAHIHCPAGLAQRQHDPAVVGVAPRRDGPIARDQEAASARGGRGIHADARTGRAPSYEAHAT